MSKQALMSRPCCSRKWNTSLWPVGFNNSTVLWQKQISRTCNMNMKYMHETFIHVSQSNQCYVQPKQKHFLSCKHNFEQPRSCTSKQVININPGHRTIWHTIPLHYGIISHVFHSWCWEGASDWWCHGEITPSPNLRQPIYHNSTFFTWHILPACLKSMALQ